jgi:hypothetical protein
LSVQPESSSRTPSRKRRWHIQHRLAGGDQLLCQQRAEPAGRLDGPGAGHEASGEVEQPVALASLRADSQLADHGLAVVEHRCGVGPLVGVDPDDEHEALLVAQPMVDAGHS